VCVYILLRAGSRALFVFLWRRGFTRASKFRSGSLPLSGSDAELNSSSLDELIDEWHAETRFMNAEGDDDFFTKGAIY